MNSVNCVSDPFPFFLPPEVSSITFSHLDEMTLLTCCLVSKNFKKFAEQDTLWQSIALKEKAPLGSLVGVKRQVKEYCCRYTRLFGSIFPIEKTMARNWFGHYLAIKEQVALPEERAKKSDLIQKHLDECIATASLSTPHVLEQMHLLIEAGGNVGEYVYRPIYSHIQKIKQFAFRDSSLSQRYKFTSHIPLSLEERQELQLSLAILYLFVQKGGRVANTNDSQTLAKIAFQYQCYPLAKILLGYHMQNTLGKDSLTQFLLSILDKEAPYGPEHLPEIKAMVKMLIQAGTPIPSQFAERLLKIGMDLKDLQLHEDA